MATTPLALITAMARAGALEQAWRLFRDGGYDAQTENPAALAVKGRLLKDQGLRASGDARQALLGRAAAAYLAADRIAPQPYLLINTATLSLLSGDPDRSATAAQDVLKRLDAPTPIAETLYWLSATRAEALLLLDDQDGAGRALETARAADPDGWPDHAATLRQLGLICAAQGRSTDWLNRHRPPHSLYFAGHLGIASDESAALRAEIDPWLDAAQISFGYGALAAGADIIIGEAIVARGADLHVVLPTARAVFKAQSVTPYGADWAERFETLMAAAASVQEATQATGHYEPRATALAADMAMGAALLSARQIESSAVQLLIADTGDNLYGDGISTARDGESWARSGYPQHVIRWPRNPVVTASRGKVEGREDRALMAVLSVAFAGVDGLGEGDFADTLDRIIAPFWAKAAVLSGQPDSTQPQGNGRVLGFASLAAAAAFARGLQSIDPQSPLPLVIAGHYGLVHRVDGGIGGAALASMMRIAGSALPGTVTVSAPFATALALVAADIRAEHVGESGDLPLFALQ